ncbi:MAG: hypothetical protein ACHQRJ_23360 [Alphaproteobacteria bacterium]
MSSTQPHRRLPLANNIIRQHGALSAAQKGIEEQELPPPDLGERPPKPPGRAEDERDPDFVEPDPNLDKIPNFYDKERDDQKDPSMEKGIPGPDITPPNEEDI